MSCASVRASRHSITMNDRRAVPGNFLDLLISDGKTERSALAGEVPDEMVSFPIDAAGAEKNVWFVG